MKLREEEPKIIIISGKARSGKDKVSLYIKEKLENMGKSVCILAYSKYIKDYASNISDWDGKDETKPRKLLQFLGTDIIRNKITKNFFINRMIEDIKVYSYFFDIIIISDARFVDEIELIKSNFKDVVSINVTRPNFVSELSLEEREHITENDLNDYEKFDEIIVNDSSLEALENKVIDLVEKLF